VPKNHTHKPLPDYQLLNRQGRIFLRDRAGKILGEVMPPKGKKLRPTMTLTQSLTVYVKPLEHTLRQRALAKSALEKFGFYQQAETLSFWVESGADQDDNSHPHKGYYQNNV